MKEERKKHIVVVSSGWGSKYGGINSFNTDFCKALGNIVSDNYSLICAVPDTDENDIKDAAGHNVNLLPINTPLVHHVANHIANLVRKNYHGDILWWVGHDVYSGDVANYGQEHIGGQSAVFQHMAYWLYSTLKSEDGNRTSMQDKHQREIAEKCDYIFAVGPLLADHARKFKDTSRVIEIIPGLQCIEKRYRSDSEFNAIIFGRMNKEDDIIKQGRLGAWAFGKFCKDIMRASRGSDIRLTLTVIGLPKDEKEYAKEYDELRDIVKKAAGREINVVPLSYTDNQQELYRRLAEHHACLMLSWHEGFGLVGWEAIAAEVPLIVSENSGLFRHLNKMHHGLTGCLHPVSIKNNEDDIDEVVPHLLQIEKNRINEFKWAEELKESLLKQGYTCENNGLKHNYTWESVARIFAHICNIPVRPVKKCNIPAVSLLQDRPVKVSPSTRNAACTSPSPVESKNQQFQLLHISDLHIGGGEDFDCSIVLEPLISRVKEDREKKGIKPEIVVVTGDIAFKGVKEEYDRAADFFDALLESCNLGQDRIFIVPGNHDVDRKKYRPSDKPAYENMVELNRELEDYREDLLKGMDDYFCFIETNYPHLQSIGGRLVPFVQSYTTQCGKNIGIVGLNSAWMCRKSDDEHQIAIGEYQIKKAMEACYQQGNMDLHLCLFHHPLAWLWPEDRKICRTYFNNTTLLCGHLHEPDGSFIHDLEGKFHQFQAGGTYQGSELACRFQYITFDWGTEMIRLDFRKFVKDRRKWVPESETGDDGKKFFEMIGVERKIKEGSSEPDVKIPLPEIPEIPEMPEMYIEWLTQNCGHMDADKLHGKGKAVPLRLPEIFIPLYTYQPGKSSECESSGAGEVMGEKQKPEDIEKIIAQNDILCIEGQAGYGKTTLLKHLAYGLSQQKDKDFYREELDHFLPLLILLKDLAELFSDRDLNPWKSLSAEDIIAWYLERRMGNILDLSTITKFIEARRAIFLLDGLDEISPEQRDMVVNAFSDVMIKYKGNHLVFTGRPHGFEGAVVQKYGSKRVKILSLTMEQVNLFIRKWFTYLYPGSLGIGGKNAEAMIGEITDHPAIEQLIDNPLMLTAICILYHDGKELPGQRAELYKKFIDNLLYRRFKDPEMVHDFLKNLAFRMQTEGIRAVDGVTARRILKGSFKIRADETEKGYTKRIEKKFDDIEPRCGLLKFENGQYTFWHLTFQEFLTAHYLVDNHTDYDRAIESYWSQDRYKEVVELYVGYLSIDSKKWANHIISHALEKTDQSPFLRWRLAARSLVDIHKDRREEPVLALAGNRLLEVMENDHTAPHDRADAGETLGWIGDHRPLKKFIEIKGGTYKLEGFGRVVIKPFALSQYPITNSWFEEFVRAGGYENRCLWTSEGQKWLEYTKAKQPLYWHERKWRCPSLPVVGVSWYEASAFTRWLTDEMKDGHQYRLPNEQEWQAAAAGVKGRQYPWGDNVDQNTCNSEEIKLEKTSPVGIFPQGRTPEGVLDLAGNVWEWTISDYHTKKVLDDFPFDEMLQKWFDEKNWDKFFAAYREKNRQFPVVRGGSWCRDAYFCRCAVRNYYYPFIRYGAIGFRCARI